MFLALRKKVVGPKIVQIQYFTCRICMSSLCNGGFPLPPTVTQELVNLKCPLTRNVNVVCVWLWLYPSLYESMNTFHTRVMGGQYNNKNEP